MMDFTDITLDGVDVDSFLTRKLHRLYKRELFAYLYGRERAIQEVIDEEGSMAVFVSLKVVIWGQQ